MASEIKNYNKVLNELKQRIRLYGSHTGPKTNADQLHLYWDIGNVILKQQKTAGWNVNAIMQLAKDLRSEFTDRTGINERNLRYMRSFARLYPHFNSRPAETQETVRPKTGKTAWTQILYAQLTKLTWYHHRALIGQVKSEEERLFYMQQAIDNAWSGRMLMQQISSRLYRRQGEAINNFSESLPPKIAARAAKIFRHPYSFDFMTLGKDHKERDLEAALIQNLKSFILKLGRGFAYMDNQFALPVADSLFYIDLLFYHTHLHCYVVIELKIDDFMPEYIGKLNFYVTKVDELIKEQDDNPTIGILLCKMPNEQLVKHAIENLKIPVGVAAYAYGPPTQQSQAL